MFGKRTLGNWAALALIIVLLAGCAPGNSNSGKANGNEMRIGKAANGQKITLKQGQVLAVRLESNPTTGFSWEVSESDSSVLKQEGKAEYEQAKPDQQTEGGGGWETYRFSPVKTGQSALKLIYHRPWEKGKAPAETFEVQVTVE